ncbi:MAG: phosphatase PAP2 family protein [Candidatus Aminicenantes bacterium]|nr:phosphatase PAP2 family protein [Candidatus Aminicenantes bacterium]
MRNKAKILLGFCLVYWSTCFSLSALPAKESLDYHLNKRYLQRAVFDWGEIGRAPVKWQKSDWFKVALISGAGLVCYWGDQKLHDWLRENKTSTSSDISQFISYLGHGGVILVGTGSGYLWGEITHNRKWRKISLLSLESWLASGFVVNLLKFLAGRERPQVHHKARQFHPFSLKSSNHAWPSGHASSAFAVAAVIASEVDSGWVDGVVYSLASLVAFSRVYDEYHWLSDVFIGSVLGYVIGHKIATLHAEGKSPQIAWGITLSPQRTGFTLTFFF